MSKFVMRRNILEFWSPKFIISPLKDSVSVDVAVKKLDLHSCRRTEDVHLTLSRSNCIVRRSLRQLLVCYGAVTAGGKVGRE